MSTASIRPRPAWMASVGLLALLMTACPPANEGRRSQAERAAQPEEEVAQAPTATCEDDAGDANAVIYGADPFAETKPFRGPVPEHADLQAVDLSLDDESLSVRYDLGAPVPADDEDPKSFPFARLGLDVYVDARHTYALFSPIEDGASPFGRETIQPKGKGGSTEFEDLGFPDATVTVDGPEVVATVPVESLPKLEGDFSWAGYVVAGQAEETFGNEGAATAYDSCPDFTREEEEQLASEVPEDLLERLPTKP